MDNTDEIMWIVYIATLVATYLLNTSRVLQAAELCQECLILLNNTTQEKVVTVACISIYLVLFKAYCLLNDHASAIDCGTKLLHFLRGFGLRTKEGHLTCQVANLYQHQSKYKEAKGLFKEALTIMIEKGDREGEAACYGNLGTVYHSLADYAKAEEYLNNALLIQRQLGNKEGEAASYGNLGSVSQSLCEYGKAEEYQRKALAIRKEIGDREGEAACYGNLGTVYHSLGEYAKAEEYLNNALLIQRQLGNKQGEAASYGNLGSVSLNLLVNMEKLKNTNGKHSQ